MTPTPEHEFTLAAEPLDTTDATIIEAVREVHETLDPMPGDLLDRIKFAMSVASLEAQEMKATPVFGRVLGRFALRRSGLIEGAPDFRIEANRLTIADEEALIKTPINIIRLFWLAAETRSMRFKALRPIANQMTTAPTPMISSATIRACRTSCLSLPGSPRSRPTSTRIPFSRTKTWPVARWRLTPPLSV